jgi:UDP-N-acetylmuramoyl-tripeptide--D-alanyl-D-alanine ligase
MLIGVRGLAEDLVRGAETQGLAGIHFAADSDAAGEMLAAQIREGDVILVKGSRGVRTEKVVERLLKEFELE